MLLHFILAWMGVAAIIGLIIIGIRIVKSGKDLTSRQAIKKFERLEKK